MAVLVAMDEAPRPTATGEGPLRLRRMRLADEQRVLGLLAASLGWVPDDLHTTYFRWKHRDNPAGESPSWVAEAGDRLIGFRAFLRWRFVRDGEVIQAVRAVDTATHPDFRGRGVFRSLTLGALDELRADGVSFVFNTPNAASLPGYLSMGWTQVGRLPVAARVRAVRSAGRVVRARQPAEKWSEAVPVGEPAAAVLADEQLVASVLGPPPRDGRLRTERTPAHLAWRYGFAPLHYRAVPLDGSFNRGLVVVRVRRRGPARELTVAEVLTPAPDGRGVARAVRHALAATRADVAIRVGETPAGRWWVPLPGRGPVLVHRHLGDGVWAPPAGVAGWALTAGDVELL